MTQAEIPISKRPEAVRVRLLGDFSVSVGSRTIRQEEWRSKKAAALIKLLALAPGHRLHRERVMDLLWPDLGKGKASNNLRQVLYGARGVLDPDSGSPERYLRLRDEQLVLCPDGQVWVDVGAFEGAAATARRSREPGAYAAAIDLYAGDLLPEDRYEEWAEGRRAELRQLYLGLHMELAALYEGREEHALAIEALRKATSEEPTLEEANASLMRLQALLGRPERTLAQYERLRDAKNHNLPASMTSFVGREREMIELKRALPMTRLLTLTGTGGSGKTRLAIEIARELAGSYPKGVWLVELAPLSEPGLVGREAAKVLGVQERPGEPLTDTLVKALAAKEMLLVLDNCEHVVEATARLVDKLLALCPRLKVLAASREPLAITGEVNWAVPPLSLPDTTNGKPDGESPIESLTRSEAVRLFVDRARLRLPDFHLNQQNTGAVAGVCRKLDGIPLAIELATSRMDSLTVEQVAQRLEVSLDVLKGTSRSATPRQQTLRATLDWSHDLLSETEQALFRRLSVFAGGWTLEAAEAVCSGKGIDEDDVLDFLGGLIDKSLVVAGANAEGTVRYRLLEPIRQYASEKLEESGHAEVVKRRHAGYFLELAEEAESVVTGARQEGWLERLEAEHDNLRVALSWSLDKEEAKVSLRLAAALWWFWYAHGYLSEGRRWLEGSLSLSDSEATQTRAWALNGSGWIAIFQGDFEAAKTFLEEALTLFRMLESEEGMASALTNLGFMAMLGQRRDIPVPTLLEEAKELRPRLRNRRTVAYLLLLEGVVTLGRGDLAYAMGLHEESVALLREVRDMQGVGGCLFNIGLIEIARGHYSRATKVLRETLSVAREADDKNIIQLALFGLANVAARRRQPVRAARQWGASEALREAFDMRLSPMTSSFANYEANLCDVRSLLGEAVFEEVWAEGKAMVQHQAVEYALSEEVSAVPPTSLMPDQQLSLGEPTGNLTRREREVASLVARGLTNRQVAQELSISARTAANHVAKILKELGLSSRTQIAGWATESQPSTTDQT